MPIINRKKIDGIKPMLLQFFNSNAPVKRAFLREKVEEDIIEIATQEGFIGLLGDDYLITHKGKDYRDN